MSAPPTRFIHSVEGIRILIWLNGRATEDNLTVIKEEFTIQLNHIFDTSPSYTNHHLESIISSDWRVEKWM